MRTDRSDAACLRDAAWVLRTRGPDNMPFSLRVIIRVLERTADKIDKGEREQGPHVPFTAPRSDTPRCAES